jgi:hypothetical protein
MKNLVLTAVALLGFAAASMGQTLPAYLPSDGLVGWWPFNGNANDESGNGNDLLNEGGSFIVDRNNELNSAISLTSTSTYLSGASVDPSIANSQSLSLWFKIPQQFNYSTLNLLGNGIAYNYGYAIFIDQNDAVYGLNNYSIGYIIGNGQSVTFNASQNELADWNNLIAIYTGDSLKLYLNNILKGTLAYSGGTNSIDNNLRIGSWDNPSLPQNTLRQLDDIAIYNRALTQEEITSLYTGEPVNPPTTCNPLPSNLQNGLVGYWPFCGNANDESGNGNDGTVNGECVLSVDRNSNLSSAYSFPSNSNSYISMGSPELLKISGEISISIWVYMDGGTLNPRAIEFGNESSGYRIGPVGSANNDRIINMVYANSTVSCTASSLEWHHISMTVESNGTQKAYLDGNLIQTNVIAGTLDNIYSNELNIGRKPTSDFDAWGGLIDDIGIWNRALTAAEVQQLYTLNACTFTVYDTVTVENIVTVYDTVTTYTTVTDTLIINTLITALAPSANTNTIKVFPNPAGSFITIDYGNFALMNGYQLRIENSLGQQVFQTNIAQQSDFLNLSNWGGNGLYFVHIVDPQGNTIDIRKIVVQ